MGCEDDVLKIGKKLEKMAANKTTEHASALDLLKMLQNLPMTLEVLQKTRIGMIVNNFRKKSSDEESISLAKALIKQWKKLLPADNPGPGAASKPKSSPEAAEEPNQDSMDSESSQPVPASQQNNGKDKAPMQRQASTSSDRSYETSDPVRLKCRELMVGALKIENEPNNMENLEDLAARIEDCIYQEFQNTESKYKNRIRSRIANLKDKKNPKLRENVLSGFIPPERIATMSSEEMASDSMKELRQKFTKEAINDHQMAKTGGTTTSLFKCGRCGKANCTYNQVQTRSADEPMTTFVLCNECGNRWKFC